MAIVRNSYFVQCPLLNKPIRIEIELAEVPISGKHTSSYKKLGYLCPYEAEHGCSISDSSKGCPWFWKAPEYAL